MDVAAAQQQRTQALAEANAARALRYWAAVSPGAVLSDWSRIAPALFVLVATAQREAARAADPYLERVADAQDAVTITESPVDPTGFSGVSASGRPLAAALITAPFQVLRSIGAGSSPEDALDVGAVALRSVVATEVADSFRVATQLSMYMRSPDTPPEGVFKAPRGKLMVRDDDGLTKPYFRPRSYVRMVQPGACSRCIILAGTRYRRQVAFDRHPLCHCTHIPVDENVEDVPPTDPKAYFDALTPAEQDKAFTKAGAEAIRLGADMSQVVNARRGMYTTQGGLLATRAGTTRRGLYGASQTEFTGRGRNRRAAAPRLMPEEIIRLSGGDREKAVRLLRQYKFIF